MRVDNRASVAYATAFCRPRLRGEKRLCGRAAHRTLDLRYVLFARHAGSRGAHKATARTLLRALGKSLRRAPTSCDNHIQRESASASSAPTCSVTRGAMHFNPPYERMAAKNARVSGPMHLSLHS
jgi:hypothetical protein